MLGSDNKVNQSNLKDFISHSPVNFLISICSHQGFLALLLLVALFIRHIRGSTSLGLGVFAACAESPA